MDACRPPAAFRSSGPRHPRRPPRAISHLRRRARSTRSGAPFTTTTARPANSSISRSFQLSPIAITSSGSQTPLLCQPPQRRSFRAARRQNIEDGQIARRDTRFDESQSTPPARSPPATPQRAACLPPHRTPSPEPALHHDRRRAPAAAPRESKADSPPPTSRRAPRAASTDSRTNSPGPS